jgi:hypothetical protein
MCPDDDNSPSHPHRSIHPSPSAADPRLSLSFSSTPFSLCVRRIGDVAIDDPSKVIRVIGSDGKSGDQRELAYTNCKVVGNGSFGVVFSAKLVSNRESF